MATCLLVYVPSLPLRVEHLMPHEELALAAAYLREAGHRVHICDFGSVSGAALVPPQGVLSRPWLLGGREDADARHFSQAVVRSLNSMVSSLTGGLDLVAFLVQERDGLAMSTMVNMHFQQGLAGGARAVCFGPYVERFAPQIGAYNPSFAAAVTEEAGTVLSRLADDVELDWSAVPGLMYREGRGAIYTGRVVRHVGSAQRPLPDYSPEVYPQVHTGDKLAYFPVAYGAAATSKSMPSVMGRIRRLRQQFPSAALDLRCGAASGEQIDALARSVHALGGPAASTLGATVGALSELPTAALTRLRCIGVQTDCFSGSQRLLDDFFAAGFTITQLEAALHGARAAGAAVAASFSCPCPWDDEHTIAETLRIVQRNRPASVTLHPLDVQPGTAWYRDPVRFGFQLQHHALARHAAGVPGARQSLLGRRSRAQSATRAAQVRQEVERLGAASDVTIQELACARVLGAGDDCGKRASTLRLDVAHGGREAVAAMVASINLGLLNSGREGTHEVAGFVRAAMGN